MFWEFFSEEIMKWFVMEMSMNCKMWFVVKVKKLWIKLMIIENGVLFEVASFSEFVEYDCRGTFEFLVFEVGVYVMNFVKKYVWCLVLVVKIFFEFCILIDGEEVAILSSSKKTFDRDAFFFVKVGEVLDEFDCFD